MKIYILNLLIAGFSPPIRLIYKSEEAAKSAAAHPIGMDGLFSLADDFGTEIRLTVAPIARIIVSLDEQLEAEIALGIAQTKAQVRAQERMAKEHSGLVVPRSGPVLPFPGGNGGMR